MLTSKELPIKLEKCPIVDAVAELRFTTQFHRQAVLGVFYEKVKVDFPEIEALPILQIPPQLLSTDPNLLFKPHHRLKGKKFSVQVGPDVLSVSPTMPYPGWSEYFPVIKDVFNALFESKIPNSIIRMGMRYTNFFQDQNVFKKVKLDLLHSGKSIPFVNTVLRTDLVSTDGFTNILQIANSAQRNNHVVGKNGLPHVQVESGSILDIDTYKEYPSGIGELEKVIQEIQAAHQCEKSFFWDILNDEAHQELKPVYNK